MVFWSFSYVWVKIVYEVFNPIATVFLRLLISVPLIFIIGKLLNKIEKIRKEDRLWFLLLALFEPFLYFIGESIGLKYLSSTLGAVIASTIPLFVPLGVLIIFKERLNRLCVVGIIVSFIGVATIILNKNLELAASTTGLMLMALAVFSAVGYSLLIKRLSSKYNAVTIIGYQNLIGLIMFSPLFFIFEWDAVLNSNPNLIHILTLVGLAVFASTFAFMLFTYGMRFLTVSQASAFTNAIPVFTAIEAYYVLNEILSSQKVLGIALVVIGLFISQIKDEYLKRFFVKK
jgi:drug/metabolite transporter (DMT)-like permease